MRLRGDGTLQLARNRIGPYRAGTKSDHLRVYQSMGFNSGLLDLVGEWFHDYELPPRCAVLDVGTSELFCADDPQSLNRFLTRFDGQPYPDDELGTMANRGLAADLWKRAGFSYMAIDFIDYPHTLKLDLNVDTLPAEHRERYTLVANSGTSEHILNQYNVFKVIHEATRPGGIMYHGVPMAGEFSHGIITYNPKFFWALASANDYDMVKIWSWASPEAYPLVESIHEELHFNVRLTAQNAYVHVLLRRTNDKPFRGLIDPAFT